MPGTGISIGIELVAETNRLHSMDVNGNIKRSMIFMMISLAASKPQYDYQPSSPSQSVALAFNVGGGSSFNQGAQIMQIIPSQPISQGYFPPVQQSNPIAQLPSFPPAAPAPQYIPPAQVQQPFQDVSQIPLQNTHSSFGGSSFNVQPQGQSSSYHPQAQGHSQGQSGGFGGQSQGFSGGQSGSFSGGQSGGHSHGQSGGFGGQSQGFSGGQSGSGGFGGQSQGFSGQSSSFNQQAAFRPQQEVIVTKDIFVHTAPQDLEDEPDINQQIQSVPIRKNYRIIFIKAPSHNLRVAAQALQQAQQINEEKTVIYVLSKKADAAELQRELSQVNAAQTVNQKPEVYFIKYKTNEEAQRAQQEIQAQYDALGGSSSVSDEGIAPVIGALGGGNQQISGGGHSGGGSGHSGSIGSHSGGGHSGGRHSGGGRGHSGSTITHPAAGSANFITSLLSSGSGQSGSIAAAPSHKYLPAKV